MLRATRLTGVSYFGHTGKLLAVLIHLFKKVVISEIEGSVVQRCAQHAYHVLENGYKKVNKNRGYDGTVTARDLHMLRETKVPSAYIELGNIKHPTDQKRLFLSANRQLISEWLFDGMK